MISSTIGLHSPHRTTRTTCWYLSEPEILEVITFFHNTMSQMCDTGGGQVNGRCWTWESQPFWLWSDQDCVSWLHLLSKVGQVNYGGNCWVRALQSIWRSTLGGSYGTYNTLSPLGAFGQWLSVHAHWTRWILHHCTLHGCVLTEDLQVQVYGLWDNHTIQS